MQVYNQYGYPKWLFIILYTIGVGGFLWNSILPWFFVYGVPTNDGYCVNHEKELQDLWVIVAVPYYLFWDWTVLGLYIFKVIQIGKKWRQTRSKSNGNDDGISKDIHVDYILLRVNMSLNKILLLTIFYEILTMINTVIGVMTDDDMGPIGVQLINIVFATVVDPVGTVVMVYLMIEHNNEIYHKFVKILDKSRVCCCLKCLIEDAMEFMSDEWNLAKQNNNARRMKSTIDTRSKLELPEKIEREDRGMSAMSDI